MHRWDGHPRSRRSRCMHAHRYHASHHRNEIKERRQNTGTRAPCQAADMGRGARTCVLFSVAGDAHDAMLIAVPVMQFLRTYLPMRAMA